jgi:ADP-ribosylglycohydrolase
VSQDKRLAAAYTSLLGLSLGDAFGETFFGEESEVLERLRRRQVQPGKWEFTDDTVMGIAVYKQLAKNGAIIQDELAAEFARNYQLDINRGYGGTAHYILRTIAQGKSWQVVSKEVFDGMGSMGNGAAMRAGPIGAYFGEDVAAVVTEARLSAEVTHANEEGICGAIAVALMASFAGWRTSEATVAECFKFVLSYLPGSDTKAKIAKAATLSPTCDIRTATAILGNGIKLTAQDTVPFALWCAAHQRTDFEAALWRAVNGLGDRDTICAIVGSIVSLSAPASTVPSQWLQQVEQVTESAFFLF